MLLKVAKMSGRGVLARVLHVPHLILPSIIQSSGILLC